jgi:hypothetical protein
VTVHSNGLLSPTIAAAVKGKAFSSEVDTGSREENASKEKREPRSDSIGMEMALH